VAEEQNSDATQLEVFQGKDEQWYWHGKADNGEIVVRGEGHTRREDAIRAAETAFPETPMSVSTTINEPTEEDGA
jgi:uncharacterized protein YegP (UPF0339 family)